MSAPRYAPAREDGTKAYVVTIACGRDGCPYATNRLVYARSKVDSRYAAIGREATTTAVAVRRASPEDVINLKEYR
jgi:hypothetical protein